MSNDARPPLPSDLLEQLNAARGGFEQHLGLRFVSASYDEVVAELAVGREHHQPYGLVHGGVYAAVIETVASVGAALNAAPQGRHTVGLENSTSFVRAARSGTIRGVARPLSRGRRTQVWEVAVRDAQEQLLATGRVRMLCVEHGAAIAGQTVELVGRRSSSRD